MQTEKTYARCRGEIGNLLEAIERNDLGRVAAHVDVLRDCLADRRPERGDSTLRQEQLEAMAGLADAIGRSLDAMHRSAVLEIERIRATRPLLRHLAGSARWVM